MDNNQINTGKNKSRFAKVTEKVEFPVEEEKVLAFWKEIDAFREQLRLSEGRKPYTFYDGPPFATGLPHYGHIAAGTIKDVMTRYATQTGHYCSRRFGWDCHGLPIEYEIDKRYNIKSSVEREEIGVPEYNRRCREIVMTYSKEWEDIVGRFGRWIDFENDYKTMDCEYMESVWWTFKQIYDKGLVYRGARIMPFSTACNTVLSNFEAGLNYKEDTRDPSVFITFPLVDEPGTSLMAWTTTPWTLPSNLACAVNPDFEYFKIKDEERDKVYIVAEVRLKDVLKQNKIKKHKVLEKLKGKDLIGKKYTPLFEYFGEWGQAPWNCFRVIEGKFVTKDAGTGVVHCAPAFGEEDYQVCLAQGLIPRDDGVMKIMPVDDDGKFVDMISDFKGLYIKDADEVIIKNLKGRQRLVSSSTVVHSYPFCWRSDTPLIYRAVNPWFIRVTDIKDDLLKNNEDPRWVPAFVQEKKFKNWLQDARDWCFSRNRYWGNPIPIWTSKDGEEVVCVGSIKELQELTGCGEIKDLHREHIDHLTIPSKQGKGVLTRIPEVFDCWFESGSMPFAQSHYPFSLTDEEFMKGFPANFIAEGIDQTRGWFYTLMVISTAVKGQAPFQNLVVNGTVLAADGKKMSKRLKNYPDPMDIAKTYGVDACRLYLCNSPVVRAEHLQFKEAGVKSVVKEIFLPWYNAYRFLVQNISRYEQDTGENFIYDSKLKTTMGTNHNFMDRWIVSANQNLIKFVRYEMDNYKLYNVVPPLLNFLEQLTNWYVRLNRTRMKGEDGADEQRTSLNILFDVLLSTTTLMSCITPFLTEHLYQNLRNGIDPSDQDLFQKSVHFLQMPNYNDALLDEKVERRFSRMQSAIENGRLIRDRQNISLKKPLSCVILVDNDVEALQDFQEVATYITEELNCQELKTEQNEDEYVEYKCEPDNRAMGQALGKAFNKQLKKEIPKMPSSQLRDYLRNGSTMHGALKIEAGWLKVEKLFKDKYQKSKEYGCASNVTSSVLLVTTMDETLIKHWHSREITNRIQKLRKNVGISIDDQIEVFYQLSQKDSMLAQAIAEHSDQVKKVIKMPFVPAEFKQKQAALIGETHFVNPEDENDVVTIYVCKPAASFVAEEMQKSFGGDPSLNLESLASVVNNFSQQGLQQMVSANDTLKVTLDGKQVELKHKQHFYLNADERF